MLKKTLMSLVLSLGLTSSLVANEELRANMLELGASMSAAQAGFFANDKKAVLAAVLQLRKDSKTILSDKKKVIQLLPDDVKYKASIAINSAELIAKYADEIEYTLQDRNMRMINQQMRTQKAFREIEKQCFRCHNLVRDW